MVKLWDIFVLAVTVAACCVIARAKVYSLTDDNFDSFMDQVPDDGLLLVDFHTILVDAATRNRAHKTIVQPATEGNFQPLCRACQRLAAVIDYLDLEWGQQEADPANQWFQVAKVDCSRNERLATVFGIEHFPDLRFVRAGQWSTYEGKRSIEGIQEFKKRMAIVELPALNKEKLQELVKSEQVVFVLATETDADPTSEAPGVALAATGLRQTLTLGTMNGEVLASLGMPAKSTPALIKVIAGPDGLLSLPFDGELRSASYLAITRWVERENHPLLAEFGPDNFSRLGLTGKLLVIGVVDPSKKETAGVEQSSHESSRAHSRGRMLMLDLETLRRVASRMGLELSNKIVFGTMDGITLKGFAETLNVFDGLPRLAVLDMARDSFFSTPEDMALEPVDIEAFLFSVLSGDVPLTKLPTDTVRSLKKIWWFIKQGGMWSWLLLLPVLGLVWVLFDTPEWEECRAAERKAKREAKEKEKAARQKKRD